jgi:hypothetical protein
MTYSGRVKNGIVVLEGGPPPADGTRVRVEVVESEHVKRQLDETSKWSAELHAWASSHGAVNHPVDDSRDSIYDGRGQ